MTLESTTGLSCRKSRLRRRCQKKDANPTIEMFRTLLGRCNSIHHRTSPGSLITLTDTQDCHEPGVFCLTSALEKSSFVFEDKSWRQDTAVILIVLMVYGRVYITDDMYVDMSSIIVRVHCVRRYLLHDTYYLHYYWTDMLKSWFGSDKQAIAPLGNKEFTG